MGSTGFRSFRSSSQQPAWEEPDFTTSQERQVFFAPNQGSESSLDDEGFSLPHWIDSTAISKDSNNYPTSFWPFTELLEIFPQSGQVRQLPIFQVIFSSTHSLRKLQEMSRQRLPMGCLRSSLAWPMSVSKIDAGQLLRA
jgi:hypothetical protein